VDVSVFHGEGEKRSLYLPSYLSKSTSSVPEEQLLLLVLTALLKVRTTVFFHLAGSGIEPDLTARLPAASTGRERKVREVDRYERRREREWKGKGAREQGKG
jgi:hypothetical protein